MITYPWRARQLIHFDGLDFKPQRPTDIDLSIDFDGWIFIYGEVKLRDTPVPTGQRWHLEKICRSHFCAGHHALALILRHEIDDTRQAIDAATCQVDEFYPAVVGAPEPTRLSWVKRAQGDGIICRDMIECFLDHVEYRKYLEERAEIARLML